MIKWLMNLFRSDDTLLSLINKVRSEHRLQLLTNDDRLHIIAQNHTNVMAKAHILAHEGLLDGSVKDRLQQIGYINRAYAEVIAFNSNPKAVVNAWLNSISHRHIILGHYAKMGEGHSGNYWCVDLIL